jgi:hypothetical protein
MNKKEIAQLLFNLPTDVITSEAIKDILSSILEDGSIGKTASFKVSTPIFNHDAESVPEACGFDASEVQDLLGELCFERATANKVSQTIELMLPKIEQNPLNFAAATAFFIGKFLDNEFSEVNEVRDLIKRLKS